MLKKVDGVGRVATGRRGIVIRRHGGALTRERCGGGMDLDGGTAYGCGGGERHVRAVDDDGVAGGIAPEAGVGVNQNGIVRGHGDTVPCKTTPARPLSVLQMWRPGRSVR
jgi:hypothetical protein